MSDHHEHEEMLALLSIDAVDDDQRDAIERHVAICPKCRAELDALRDVAGRLGNVVTPPPAHVWTAIAQRLYDSPATAEERPPLRALTVVDGDRRDTRRTDHHRLRRAATAVVTFAAAAAIALVSVGWSNADHRAANLQAELSNPGHLALLAAMRAPGHRDLNMRTINGTTLATVVLLPSGSGYVVPSRLAALPANETYQLWAIADGTPVSLGLMGHHPTAAAFTVNAASWPTALAMTVEPATGTAAPTTTPIGTVTI